MSEDGCAGRRGPKHWLVVTSEDNFSATARRRFSVQGFKRRHRRTVEKMRPGDRMCWYVTRAAVFTATATVRSPLFEDGTAVWRARGTPDTYPWRVRLRRDHSVPVARGVEAAGLVPGMRFAARYPRAHWRLALQGQVREIGRSDLAKVERAVAAREQR